MPAFLQSDLSPRTLELFAEARAIGGAYRFHQWAASQLPPNVRAHYGERFVLGAHHLLADNFPSLSVAHNLFDPKPEPTVLLDCPLCSCKTDDGKRADCLIRRFHNAFESITSEGIAEWYSGLDGLAAKDVRAFFRGAAPTHPPIREAFGQILTEELLQREGLQVNVNVKGKQTPPRKTLRDAFALTAMVAIKEWLNPSSTDMDAYAGLVADRFEFPSADSVVNGLENVYPEDRESGNRR